MKNCDYHDFYTITTNMVLRYMICILCEAKMLKMTVMNKLFPMFSVKSVCKIRCLRWNFLTIVIFLLLLWGCHLCLSLKCHKKYTTCILPARIKAGHSYPSVFVWRARAWECRWWLKIKAEQLAHAHRSVTFRPPMCSGSRDRGSRDNSCVRKPESAINHLMHDFCWLTKNMNAQKGRQSFNSFTRNTNHTHRRCLPHTFQYTLVNEGNTDIYKYTHIYIHGIEYIA